ncbi:MAG: hypothetical protein AAF337_01750 [Pseudomonadota bacterium]
MHRSTLLGTISLIWVLNAPTVLAATLTTDLSIVASDAAGVQPFVEAFRAVLGSDNGTSPVNADPNGRREIDWDDAVVDVVAPNTFPGDYYNQNDTPLARGIAFEATGDTEGFAISASAGFGEPVRFDRPNDFFPYSQERLFSPVGGTTFDISFFDPSTQVDPALSRGLGIVFSDVEVAGATTITLFDIDGNELLTRAALAGASGGLSFVGVIFDEPTIARASITSGNIPIGAAGLAFGETATEDSVVLDDLIFGEPVPVDLEVIPLPAGLPLGLAGLGALAFVLHRKNRKASAPLT